MATATKAPARPKLDNDAWETRALGASLDHAQNSGEDASKSLDEALGLQSISIRLPKQLIEQYKIIANHHKVGYQPLMRDVLGRFVPQALKEIMQEHMDALAAAEKAKAAEIEAKAPTKKAA